MDSLVEEFEVRRTYLTNIAYSEAGPRISGFYQWLKSEEIIREIVTRLEEETGAAALLENSNYHEPPKASTPEEVAGVGCILMRRISGGEEPHDLSHTYGIRPPFQSSSVQDVFEALFERYISPALDYLQRRLRLSEVTSDRVNIPVLSPGYPAEIHEGLIRFRKDHPDSNRAAFVMMQFGSTPMHKEIIDSIRETLGKYGIAALRADDKQYHDDLFGNVLTYLYGCSFGIAVFERLEAEDFNPNVSLEVGYMRALRSSVCLLKDRTLRTLQTDLVGRLYKEFDPQDPSGTISSELEKWLRDKDIIAI